MKFEDLEIWLKAREICQCIESLIQNTALRTNFSLKDQIDRSSGSIMDNIAEGFERVSAKECVTFLSYAKGSCGELRTQIYVGIEIEYISKEMGTRWLKETEEISLMLGGLIKAKKSFVQK